MKSFCLTAEELAYIFTLMERVNHFHHAERNGTESLKFSIENYPMIRHAFYKIFYDLVGDDAVNQHSDLDDGSVDGNFEKEMELWLKCILDKS